MGWDDDKTGDYVPPEVPLRVILTVIAAMVTIVLVALGLRHPGT